MTLPATTAVGSVDERTLLRHVQGRVPAAAGVLVGMGDDAAAVEIGPFALVASGRPIEAHGPTLDAVPPQLYGRKAATVALSDVAAMGGIARYATVTVQVPPETELAWLDSLYDGLLERCAEAGVGLVGNAVSRRPGGLLVGVTLLGDAGRLLLRGGASPGDRVVVTGTLGAAAEGERLLEQGARLDGEGGLVATGVWTESSAGAVLACLRALLDPRPPLALARSVAERGLAHAGMDLADGLSRDLPEMCRSSDVAAVLDIRALPLDARVRGIERARGKDALALGLHGGGDYGLLLAVGPEALDELRDLARVWGVEVTAIGEFVSGSPQVRLRTESGEDLLEPLDRAALFGAGA